MLEIDVTRLVTDLDPCELSASIAERGPDAGRETWANSLRGAGDPPLLADDEVDPARDYFGGFGAWDDEERAAWSPAEVCALVLQYAAGDLRTLQSLAPGKGLGDIDWREAERLASVGTCSGNLFVQGSKLYVCLSD